MLRVGQSCLLLQAFWAGSASFNTRHTLASGTYNSIALSTAKRMEEVDQTYSERFALTRRAWNNTPMSPAWFFSYPTFAVLIGAACPMLVRRYLVILYLFANMLWAVRSR